MPWPLTRPFRCPQVRSAASHAYHRLLNPAGHDKPEMHGKHGRGLGLAKVELKQEDFEKSIDEVRSGAAWGWGAQWGEEEKSPIVEVPMPATDHARPGFCWRLRGIQGLQAMGPTRHAPLGAAEQRPRCCLQGAGCTGMRPGPVDSDRCPKEPTPQGRFVLSLKGDKWKPLTMHAGQGRIQQ